MRARFGVCLAGALAVSALASGTAAAKPNVCATLGLTAGAVIRADGILSEDADDQGRPECVLYTKKGRAYVSIYPPSLAADVKKSWGFDIAYQTEPLPDFGPGAACVYTKGYAVEGLGFTKGGRFVWMTTASRFIHAELLLLAASMYAKL